MQSWILDHWFDILSAVGIVGGLAFTSVSLRSEAKTRRIANLLTLTQNHRELWEQLLRYPALNRVLSDTLDLQQYPVTREERIFVNFVIQHLNSVFGASEDELVTQPEKLRRDVRAFFALPIPTVVWKTAKTFQNKKFATFVDNCRQPD